MQHDIRMIDARRQADNRAALSNRNPESLVVRCPHYPLDLIQIRPTVMLGQQESREPAVKHVRALVLVFCSVSAPLSAAIFSVNSTTDAVDLVPGDGICEATATVGDCSIRAAIMETNALAGADTINVPAGTFTLTLDGTDEDASSGELNVVSSDVIINGAGASATILDAGGIDRFFMASDADLVINDLTIQGGLIDADSILGGGIAMFTAIVNPNSLQLTRVRLLNNQGKRGGGLYAGTDVVVTLVDTLVQGNSTVDVGIGNRAGAAIMCQGCDMTIQSSAIINNVDDLSGKVVEVEANGTIALLNSTITGSFGGGVRASNGNIRIRFSTIKDNGGQNLSFFSNDDSHIFEVTGTILQSDTSDNCQSGDLPMSGGYNVVSDASCSFSETGDLENTDALLGGLADNGGPTSSFLPAGGSPVIDQVPLVDCTDLDDIALVVDQRGGARPQGETCDIGSVELAGSDPSILFEDGFEGG